MKGAVGKQKAWKLLFSFRDLAIPKPTNLEGYRRVEGGGRFCVPTSLMCEGVEPPLCGTTNGVGELAFDWGA